MVPTPKFPDSPNLRNLGLLWLPCDANKKIDFFFVRPYQKLESLSLKLFTNQVSNFDFLVDLPYLKKLDLSFIESCGLKRRFKPSLPNLTKLEKFALYNDEPKFFIIHNVKSFVPQNQNLQSLELIRSIQDIADILEDASLTLTAIENL